MESLKPEIVRLFDAKNRRRRQLAALPFPAKVRLVVQLQRMAAPILRARGRTIHVWAIEEVPIPARRVFGDSNSRRRSEGG